MAEYTVRIVITAKSMSSKDNRARTLVREVVHIPSNTTCVVKSIPLRSDEQRKWAYSEMRIHYALSQMDAEAVRGMKDDNMFEVDVSDEKNPLRYDDNVNEAIRKGTSWNIVPLFDFAVRNGNITVPPGPQDQMAHISLESGLPMAYMTMQSFEKTIDGHAKTLPMQDCVTLFRDLMAQISAVLHQLMAIEFTHGDLKLENIAFIPIGGNPKTVYHELAPNKFVVLQKQSAYMPIFDFGFARARFNDARGRQFDFVPDMGMLQYRFGSSDAKKVFSNTFAPVLDLFRITEGICHSLADLILTGSEFPTTTKDADHLVQMLQVVVAKLPRRFVDSNDASKTMRNFVDNLRGSKEDQKSNASAFKNAWRLGNDNWIRMHTSIDKKEFETYALPWDVLDASGLVSEDKPSGDNVVDLTMKPLVKKKKRYINSSFTSDATFRVAPIKSHKP